MNNIELLSCNYIDPETGVRYTKRKFTGSAIGRHCHDFYEYVLVINGMLEHEVEHNSYRMYRGHITLVSPGQYHRLLSGTYDCVISSGGFDVQTMKEHMQHFNLNSEYFMLFNQTGFKIPNSILAAVEERISYLMSIPLSKKQLTRTSFRALLAELLLIPAKTNASELIGDPPDWFTKAAGQMNQPENYREGIQKMIYLSGKTREHTSRVCKRHTGKSLTEFVNSIRIKKAAEMLINTDKRIVSVCYDCGFESLSYFYNLFNDQFHTSPARYKQTFRF